jgi:hypothetical protein
VIFTASRSGGLRFMIGLSGSCAAGFAAAIAEATMHERLRPG